MDALPVIDLSPVPAWPSAEAPSAGESSVAAALDRACRDLGFFLVVGHGVPGDARRRLERSARAFFALPAEEKARIAMAKGGRAWRGWFPEGGELTSGRPDRKEGLYFGAELGPQDPRVAAGLALHGPNLFPSDPATLRSDVLGWIDAMTTLGHRLVRLMSIGLGLRPDWFHQHLTRDPTILFRIFRYPPQRADDHGWGVAEHTDYGLVTILATDGRAGLEVRTPAGWQPVPSLEDAFVVNLGDMLEAMTAGRYRSTPHRVRHLAPASAPDAAGDRLSFPFFFDPGWQASIRPIDGIEAHAPAPSRPRWDGVTVDDWSGTYGDYLTAKVGKVFPDLAPGLGAARSSDPD